MRLQDRSLSFVVNFLLGVSWAITLIGAASFFLFYYHNSFFFAIILTLVGALPGLVLILLLEHIITSKEKHLELKKQTEILEKILAHKENHTLK